MHLRLSFSLTLTFIFSSFFSVFVLADNNATADTSAANIPRYIAVLPATGEQEISDRNDIRLSLHNVLSATEYELLKPTDIDHQLDLLTNEKKLSDFSNADIARHLRVDGILKVELSKQQKIYAAAYASYTVGIKAELYSLQSNSVIWTFDKEETERDGGVSLNPLSFVATAITSSQVLKDSVRLQLIDQISREFVNKIPKPQLLAEKEKPAKIISAYSNAADSPFVSGKEIRVQMEGEPGLKVVAKISNSDITFALNESDNGLYLGRYIVKQDDNVTNSTISLYADKRLKKYTKWDISGTLTIDNTAPEKVRQATAKLQGAQVVLDWANNNETSPSWLVSRSEKNRNIYQELTKSTSNTYTDTTITPGTDYIYRLIAIDEAGNKSIPAEIQVATVRLGPTTLEASINTSKTLSAAGSPYLLGKNTVIPRNVVLTVEAGTTFKAEDNSVITIAGALKALGTESAPIVIYANHLTINHEFNNGIDNNYHYVRFEGSTLKNNNKINLTDSNTAFKGTQFQGTTVAVAGDSTISIEDSGFMNATIGLIATAGKISLNRISFNKLETGIDIANASIVSANAIQFSDNIQHIHSSLNKTNAITLDKPVFINEDYISVREKMPENIVIHWDDPKNGTNLYYTWEQQHWQTIVDLAQQQKWLEVSQTLTNFEPSQLTQDLIDTLYLIQNPMAEPPAASSANTMLNKFAAIPKDKKASLVWLPEIENSKGFTQDYLQTYFAKELAGGVLDITAIRIEPLYQYQLPYERGTLTLVNKTDMDFQLLTYGFLREPTSIVKANALMPAYDSLCPTPLVWRYGNKTLDAITPVTDKSCFMIDLVSAKDAEIYLFALSPDNHLVLLEPNNCQYNHLLTNKIAAQQYIAIPQNDLQQAGKASWQEWPFSHLFLSLVSDSNSLDAIKELLDNATPVCDSSNLSGATFSLDSVTKTLSIADIKTGGKIQWRKLPLGVHH